VEVQVLADADDTADGKEEGDGGNTNVATVNTDTYMWEDMINYIA
jgi:hypothetical protein